MGDGCVALFFIAILHNCVVRVIIFVFCNHMLIKYAFRTKVISLTASCFIVSFGSLRISSHKTLCCC